MTAPTVTAKPVEADRVAVVYRSHLHGRTWVCAEDDTRQGDILAGPQGVVMVAAEAEAATFAGSQRSDLVWYRHSPDCWHLYNLDPALSEDVLDLERT